jgi:hypothetical protein
MSSTPVKHHRPIEIQGIEYGVARCKVTHAELTDADTSQAITWAAAVASHPTGSFSPPANARIMGAWVTRITDGSGGTVDALTVNLGDAGNDDELLAAVDLFTGSKATATISIENGAYTLGTFEATAYSPILTFTSGTGNLVALTAGEWEFCVAYQEISTDARVLA